MEFMPRHLTLNHEFLQRFLPTQVNPISQLTTYPTNDSHTGLHGRVPSVVRRPILKPVHYEIPYDHTPIDLSYYYDPDIDTVDDIPEDEVLDTIELPLAVTNRELLQRFDNGIVAKDLRDELEDKYWNTERRHMQPYTFSTTDAYLLIYPIRPVISKHPNLMPTELSQLYLLSLKKRAERLRKRRYPYQDKIRYKRSKNIESFDTYCIRYSGRPEVFQLLGHVCFGDTTTYRYKYDTLPVVTAPVNLVLTCQIQGHNLFVRTQVPLVAEL